MDHLKEKPVLFKRLSDPNYPDCLKVECRLKVLSSQHEQSFFRVKIKGVHPVTGQDFYPPLYVISSPIRVISKSEQFKKKPELKKLPFNSILAETISRIEKRQAEQELLIDHLISQAKRARTGPSPFSPIQELRATRIPLLEDPHQYSSSSFAFHSSSSFYSASSIPHAISSSTSSNLSLSTSSSSMMKLESPEIMLSPFRTPEKEERGEKEEKEELSKKKYSEFQEMFLTFFEQFTRLPPEDRPTKIRHLMQSCSPEELKAFSEFLDVFGIIISEPGCTCVPCPYEQEVKKMTAFYGDIITFPLSSSNPSNENQQLDLDGDFDYGNFLSFD